MSLRSALPLALLLGACSAAAPGGNKDVAPPDLDIATGYGFEEGSDWDVETPELEIAPPADTAAEACTTDPTPSLFLSSDDSNSMSAAQRARGLALNGYIAPLPSRVWEFMNYYSFDYEPAGPDQLSLDVQLTKDPDLRDGEYRLQIGVTSEARDVVTRAPMNLVLSLDTSGSMSGKPVDRMRDACHAIADSLRAGDVLSAVTWANSNNVKLSGHIASGPSDPAVEAVCDDLWASGSTDLSGGLRKAYDLAQASFDETRVNRVVLVSDGGANLGVTDEQVIGEGAGSQDEHGVYLVGVGVGSVSSYDDHLMDEVTDLGRGASMFLDTREEARKMLVDRFLEVMDVAAREVEVRLDLPPGFEVVRFSGEELSTVRDEIEPQHLAPNDSMVFFQHVIACDPTSVTPDTPITVGVTYKNAGTFQPQQLEQTFTIGELLAGETRQLRRGAALFSYAEYLRTGEDFKRTEAYARLDDADTAYPNDAELAEIRAVLDALQP